MAVAVCPDGKLSQALLEENHGNQAPNVSSTPWIESSGVLLGRLRANRIFKEIAASPAKYALQISRGNLERRWGVSTQTAIRIAATPNPWPNASLKSKSFFNPDG